MEGVEIDLVQVYLAQAALFGYWGRLVDAQDNLQYKIQTVYMNKLDKKRIFLSYKKMLYSHPRHQPVLLCNQMEQYVLKWLVLDQPL